MPKICLCYSLTIYMQYQHTRANVASTDSGMLQGGLKKQIIAAFYFSIGFIMSLDVAVLFSCQHTNRPCFSLSIESHCLPKGIRSNQGLCKHLPFLLFLYSLFFTNCRAFDFLLLQRSLSNFFLMLTSQDLWSRKLLLL